MRILTTTVKEKEYMCKKIKIKKTKTKRYKTMVQTRSKQLLAQARMPTTKHELGSRCLYTAYHREICSKESAGRAQVQHET